MIIKNEAGEDVEVLTADEAQEKFAEVAKAAIDAYVETNPHSDKIEALEATISELTTQIAAAKRAPATPSNNKREEELTAQKEMLEAAVKAAVAPLEEKLSVFQSTSINETKSEMLDKLSDGDDDLKKKIELEFNNYKPNENSKAAIQERMQKAYQLATGNRPTPGVFDGVIGSGNRGNAVKKSEPGKMSDNAIEMAKMLGITEDDIKRHNQKNK